MCAAPLCVPSSLASAHFHPLPAAPRSGLAWKNFIDTGAGVIDSDYRGNVGVILFNHGGDDFQVKRGDRIAQLILERIFTPDVVEVEDLDATVRGAGGFGSTGVSDKADLQATANGETKENSGNQ